MKQYIYTKLVYIVAIFCLFSFSTSTALADTDKMQLPPEIVGLAGLVMDVLT